MPEYVLIDSTGYEWTVSEQDLPTFMERYPDARLVEEKETDLKPVEESLTVDTTIDPIETESTTTLEKDNNVKGVLDKYDPERVALVEAFRGLDIDKRSKLSAEDHELGKEGNWDNISDEGKQVIMADYTFPLNYEGPKDFNSFKNYLVQDEIEYGVGAEISDIETSAYDDYSVFGSGLESSQEKARKRNQYKTDLNNAVAKVEEGVMPTHVLDGKLGGVLIGQEEKVVDDLRDMFKGYGFKFDKDESGLSYFTDDMVVTAGNGNKIKIKLDNWTDEGDIEQAAKLKSFLEQNKEEYKAPNYQDMVKAMASLDGEALENMKRAVEEKDQKWYENWWADEIDKVDEDKASEWRNIYDEDLLKQETQRVENDIVKLNEEFALNEAKINDYTNRVATLQSQIDAGTLGPDEIIEKQNELNALQQSLKIEGQALQDRYRSEVKPAVADLNLVAAKQTLVEEGRGDFGIMTTKFAGGVFDSLGTFYNQMALAFRQGDIENIANGDEEKLKQLLDREAKMVIYDKFTKDSDVSNEYEKAFNNSMAGMAYKSIVEMTTASVATAPLLLFGPAGAVARRVAFGTMMGGMVAGFEAQEMQSEDFAGMTPKEKLAYQATIGSVVGAIEAAMGPLGSTYGKLISIPAKKGIKYLLTTFGGKTLRNAILKQTLRRTAGKAVGQGVVKRTALDVLQDFGNKAISREGLSNAALLASLEGVTEGAQEFAQLGITGIWAENTDANGKLWDETAKEITFSKIMQATTLGVMAGGPIGVIQGGFNASKSGTVNMISDQQFNLMKRYYLDPAWQKLTSDKEMLSVLDPDNKLTKEQAELKLREYRNIGGILREVDGMGLTTKGEKQAYNLIQRKQELQKQIDKATDKALVKRQREEISAINEVLEEISVNENFEVAYERGLAETAKRAEMSDKGFILLTDKNEFAQAMRDLGQTDENNFEGTPGYDAPDGTIYINDEVARNLRQIGVSSHELLHGVTGKQIKALGLTAEQKADLVDDFKSRLSSKEFDVVAERMEAYGTDPENATSEEWFNAFVEGIVNDDIKYAEGTAVRMGEFLADKLFKPLGFRQANFANGRSVYRFLKSYGQQSRRIARGQQDTYTGDVAAIVDQGIDTPAIGLASKVPTVAATDLAAQYKDGTITNEGSIDFIEQYHKLGKAAMGFDQAKGDITEAEAISFLNKEFPSIMKNYDPSRELQFSTYLNNTIPFRAVDFYEQQIGDKAKTTSTDSDNARQLAADDTSPVDTRTDREIRQAERKGVKVREKLDTKPTINREGKVVRTAGPATSTTSIYKVDRLYNFIRSKAKKQNMRGKTLKQLKGFALREVVDMIARDNKDLADSMFKKIEKNSDLNKAEMLAIQNFIFADPDLAKGSLIEGYTSEFKATGVVNKLLEKFYNKRSVRAQTGAGLNVQIKKPNISDTEFKEAFGIIGRDRANWNQKVPASKGGVSDILKGFVRNLDQIISSQEIREQAIADGKPVEALRTLSDGMPQGFFSRTAKNLDLETQIALVNLLTSDQLLDNAESFRVLGNSNWLASALVNMTTPAFRKAYGLPPATLRTIGNELQQEFDPKKSWKQYVKKAAAIQIEEAKLGIYSTLRQIAKARGLNIDTGTSAYSDLTKLNVLRAEISNLLQDLKAEGVTDADISKFILPALVGSYKMGKFKLNNNRIAPSAILQDADIFIDKGTPRQGIYGSATDGKANSNIESTEKISQQIHKHDVWYNKPLSREQQKKYGVKNFDDLPLKDRARFVKNELQPEGLRAKKVFDIVIKKMAELYKDKKLSAQTAAVFIDLQFARMDGLGKLASDIRFIPVDTKAQLKKIFNLKPIKRGKNKDGSQKYIEDPFVLEHTIPGNRIKLASFNAVLGGDKKAMGLFDSELEQYHSAIIPYNFDELVNRKNGKELYLRTTPAIRQAGDFALSETGRYADRSRFPMSLYDVNTKETYGEPQALQEPVEESRQSNNDLGFSSKVISNVNVNGFFSKTNADEILNFETTDKATTNGNKVNQPVKKIRVFDFDDTLATSKNLVFATKGDERIELNAEEFATEGDRLLNEGYKFDFTDFNTVRDGKRGPLFELAKRIKNARGNEDLYVLTARAPEAQTAIYEFLKSQGLEFKKSNIVGLGDSTGAAKAQWMISKYAEGYNDFYFADDAFANVNAVKKAFEVLDVKGRVQQAKADQGFRSVVNVNKRFNDIIQQNKGVKSDVVFSDVRAKLAGQKNDKFKFWIPYSAEDLTGLIYPLLGKGKKGDADMKFFKEMLFDPLARANAGISASRLQMMEDFKALKKVLNVPKNINKENETGFTTEQTIRMYIWNSLGVEIPGVTKAELDKAVEYVDSRDQLKTFAQQLINITKGDGWVKPNADWFAGTIQTDLLNLLNTTKRSKFLQEFNDNADIIFSKENLNKLEAIFGSKYREAITNMLRRIKTGKNRITGGNRLSDRVLNYINGSIGAIMFFNMRSAVLQTISSINFINWSDNNPLKAGAAFANQSQYWKDFKTLMNSDFLKDRRAGLRLNINENEIADLAKTAKNKGKAAISYLLRKGYLPTQFADSFAIASGGATFYRNRINTYLKQGLSKAEAEAKAMQDFREIAEESQQSSRPDKISQQQASDLGRVLLAFANTPMQYGRLTKRAYQDLINGRGDAKSNISKIIYYTFVQNMIFNALQQAVFALGFGDDEDDEKKEKKYMDTANGMADSILRGLGIAGSAVSVAKNFLLDLYERSGRSRPEYVDSVYKLLQFSPPISSKISKVRQAAWMFDSKKRRQEMIDKGFSLDNPAYEAFAKVFTATTNVPLDRLYLKLDNIEHALAEDTETWQRVANLLGWPTWQLEDKAPVKKKKKTSSRGGYKSRSGMKRKTKSKRTATARTP